MAVGGARSRRAPAPGRCPRCRAAPRACATPSRTRCRAPPPRWSSAMPRSESPCSSAMTRPLDVLPERRQRRRGDALELAARADRLERLARACSRTARESLPERGEQLVLVGRASSRKVASSRAVERRDEPRRDDVASAQAARCSPSSTALAPSRVAISRARSKSTPRVRRRAASARGSARIVARREHVQRCSTARGRSRSASATVGAERGVLGRASGSRRRRSVSLVAEACPPPRSEPAGPMPSARITMNPTTSTANAPTRDRAAHPGAPPRHVRARLERQRRHRALRRDGVPPGVSVGVAVKARCATRCT